MATTLKKQALSAVLWTGLGRCGRQGVMLLIQLVLARLLEREEFGLLVIPVAIASLSKILVDGGFGRALIQKKDITEADKCSVFYFNIFVGFLITAGIALSAPWIATFYGKPQLAPLIRWISLAVLIRSIGTNHSQLLTKAMNFKAQLKATMVAVLIGGATGITLAAIGFGVWALVAQTLVIATVWAIAIWIVSPWRPSWRFSWSSLKSLLPFGSRVFASSLLTSVFSNLYMLLFGKLFTVGATLGDYTQARRLQLAPTGIISNIVQRVSFPLFASIQDSHEKIRVVMRKSISMLCLINMPIILFLATSGEVLITVLIGEKWLPAVPYLRIIAIWGIIQPLQTIHVQKFMGLGHSGLYLKIDILRKGLTILNILITYHFNSILIMLAGQALCNLIGFLICMHETRKLIDYSFRDQFADMAKPALVTGIMAAGVWAIGLLSLNVFLLLGLQILVAGVIWFGLALLLRIPIFMEMLGMGRAVLAKRKRRKTNELDTE
ncbi:MAG: lipopolysaccharide biosynthesis protein [Phycisphaerales bacterium]|jgi:O-antigen/teichoic acid export membrane protein|nr:lipopolysaccharide biosynthesis protein [Phycisphaerales bacterium]